MITALTEDHRPLICWINRLCNNRFLLSSGTVANEEGLRDLNRRIVALGKELGIPVSITAGANSNAVADYAFALMMACARRVTEINAKCKQKEWKKITTTDVYGKTIGILGLGAIGKGVAKRAQGFGMTVLAYDVFWNDAYAKANDITYATPEEIYKACDFISLHLPLTPETRNMISDEQFAMMKPTTVFVNTARGGIVDEAALRQAVESGHLAGAAVDVVSTEPMRADCPLAGVDGITVTPHVAWAPVETRARLMQCVADNLQAFLQGNAQNVVKGCRN